VDVRLLVPGSSDLAFVRNLTRFGYRDLLRAGVRIFEWVGPMLHAKTVVADNRWVRIGSSNLNHSSLVANFELDVLVDSIAIADQMEARYRLDLENAAEVATRPVRVHRRLQRVLPNALRIQGPTDRRRPRRRLRERRTGSVLAVRTLVASARLAIFGSMSLVLATVGTLFFLVPKVMAVVFGLFSVWLALVSGAEAVRRRADPPERTE
jgi:cardiolipin synthase